MQPFLEAERRSVSLARECRKEIDLLERKLRVGTHVKEQNYSSEDSPILVITTPKTTSRDEIGTSNNGEKEEDKTATSTANLKNKNTLFKISNAGYSILNALGEQMDKLRAEQMEEQEERRRKN